jgi:mannan endo-1,4-beta-mannosidase
MIRLLKARVMLGSTSVSARFVVLGLAAGLAVVTSAIWISPPVSYQGSVQPTADPLEAAVNGARAARDAASSHLADLTAQNAALATKLTVVAKAPRAVVVHPVYKNAVKYVAVKKPIRWPRCSDFRWQQDAQKAYLKNLADPYGLDGAPGPHNDDGIACNQLRVDPRRAASRPAGAYVAPLPTPPSKAAIMAEPNVRFGLYTTQSPNSFSEVNLVAAMMQKRPDTVGYFVGWDQPFRADSVIESWRNNALPLLTWESHANGAYPRAPDSAYALSKIIGGQYDAYIDSFAAGIAKLKMPLAIRLDHEMNGNWYAWSEDQKYNAKGQYVQMWRHVYDRFQAAGANKYVIWMWAPTRVDNIGHQSISQYYPGDAYVDWVGMDGYYRDGTKSPTFSSTFGKTLTLLRALSDKPIFLGEVGATESGGRKAAWVQDFFANLPLNKDIVGFAWFNIAVTSGTGAGKLTNDWRIDSSGASIVAFKAGIASNRYSNQPRYQP